jgi:hypothetical protein
MSDISKEIEEVEEIVEKTQTHEEEISQEAENLEVSESAQEHEESREDETNVDHEGEETLEEVVEDAAVIAVATSTQKVKKHIAAKQIIEEARNIVEASEKEVNECKLLLENDLRDYHDAKRALKEGGLEDAKALLVELGHATMEELDNLEEPTLEIEDDVEPIYIKEVSSGRFTGLILSLLAGAATLGGLVYVASEKLGITLDVTKVPSDEVINKISTWYANTISMGDNVQAGMGLIAVIVLFVMFIVYALRVGMKGGSNLRFANQQMEDTQKFVEQKHNCKAEMEKVDAYVNEAIATLKDYQVLLNEQNGKLHRVMHFEKEEAQTHGYSHSSKEEMNETQDLIATVQTFISQPMLEKGKLLEEATYALSEAKERVTHFLRRFV